MKRKMAPEESIHSHSLTADGENNSSVIIEQGKRSFNIIQQGQRIASFLNRSKALSYAKDAAS